MSIEDSETGGEEWTISDGFVILTVVSSDGTIVVREFGGTNGLGVVVVNVLLPCKAICNASAKCTTLGKRSVGALFSALRRTCSTRRESSG